MFPMRSIFAAVFLAAPISSFPDVVFVDDPYERASDTFCSQIKVQAVAQGIKRHKIHRRGQYK
jgi:hypothetical protein